MAIYVIMLVPSAPSAAELQRATAAQASIVLAADGSEIAQYERSSKVRVPLDSIAPVFLDALLAVEDRRFHKHKGIDWRRTARAGLRTASGRMEGGSTITQQLARNLYPDEIGRTISVNRKIKEVVAARRIERSHSKEQILEAYVNTVPFLYNAFGVEMAARTYFGKDADELDTNEAATLVGMLKGTSYYNPVRNPERSINRRNLVLDIMAEQGHLTPVERDSLVELPLELDFSRIDGPPSRHPHFTRYVREWLSEWADRHGYDVYRDGLVIHTTLEPTLQAAAERAARQRGDALHRAAGAEWADASGPFGALFARNPALEEKGIKRSSMYRELVARGLSDQQALDSIRADRALTDSLRQMAVRLETGFVAVEPKTGYVRAWVGSRDASIVPFDHVSQAKRQPGSVFKPFVFAAALQRGFLPGDTFVDERKDLHVDRNRVWSPTNAGGHYTGGPMTLTEALAYSKNTVTAQLMMEVGPTYVASLARDAGVRESRLEPVPSLALGTSDVSLLEMVSAYNTFASGGVYHPPVPVTRIESKSGRVLAEFGSGGERAIPTDVAQVVTLMLGGAVDRGTGRRIRGEFGISADVAGKTGTSQRGADGWFILMHPRLVAGAWVGFPEPSSTFRTSTHGQGSSNALLVVGDFFREAVSHLPDARFEVPVRYQDREAIWAQSRSWYDDYDFDLLLEGFDDYAYSADDLDFEDWEPDYDPLDDLNGDGWGDVNGDATDDMSDDDFVGPPQDGAEDDSPESADPEDDEPPTAVQELYQRAGEELDEDLRDNGNGNEEG